MSATDPDHYKTGMPQGVEVIDIINAQGADFLHGSIIKYILRWKYKNGIEDLKKAQVYLNWLVEREEMAEESVQQAEAMKVAVAGGIIHAHEMGFDPPYLVN